MDLLNRITDRKSDESSEQLSVSGMKKPKLTTTEATKRSDRGLKSYYREIDGITLPFLLSLSWGLYIMCVDLFTCNKKGC